MSEALLLFARSASYTRSPKDLPVDLGYRVRGESQANPLALMSALISFIARPAPSDYLPFGKRTTFCESGISRCRGPGRLA